MYAASNDTGEWVNRCLPGSYAVLCQREGKIDALGTESAPSSLAALAIAVGFALCQSLGHTGDQPL